MVQANHIYDETPRPSPEWLALSDVQRLALIRNFFLPSVLEVHGVVVIVPTPSRASAGWNGEYLRQVEEGLRTHLSEPLEVYCEVRKDQNQPRDPLIRQKIIGWLQARERMKLTQAVS